MDGVKVSRHTFCSPWLGGPRGQRCDGKNGQKSMTSRQIPLTYVFQRVLSSLGLGDRQDGCRPLPLSSCESAGPVGGRLNDPIEIEKSAVWHVEVLTKLALTSLKATTAPQSQQSARATHGQRVAHRSSNERLFAQQSGAVALEYLGSRCS